MNYRTNSRDPDHPLNRNPGFPIVAALALAAIGCVSSHAESTLATGARAPRRRGARPRRSRVDATCARPDGSMEGAHQQRRRPDVGRAAVVARSARRRAASVYDRGCSGRRDDDGVRACAAAAHVRCSGAAAADPARARPGAADRQRRFAKSHTYFYDPDGGTAWATTQSSISYVRGHVVDQYEHHELVATPGRCVLATQPFGPEGMPNPTLTFHVVGAAPRLFGRCYLRHAPDGHMTVTVGGARARVIDDHGLREHKPRFDFAVEQGKDGPLVNPARAFGDLEISVDSTYYDGVVIGVDREGDLRPADQYKIAHLAAGRVFWDRDGVVDVQP